LAGHRARRGDKRENVAPLCANDVDELRSERPRDCPVTFRNTVYAAQQTAQVRFRGVYVSISFGPVIAQ
jgi:hypothetical protein